MGSYEASDDLISTVFEHVPGAVWVTDSELRVQFVGGALVDALGLNAKDIIGTTIHDFTDRYDPSGEGLRPHLAALRGENQAFVYHFREHFLEVAIRAVGDVHGRVVQCVERGPRRHRTRRS